MTYVVVATFTAQPDHGAEMYQHLVALAAASRGEPGCLHYEVMRGAGDGPTFLVVERYVDEGAFAEHRASSHFQEHVIEGILPLATDRTVAFYEPGPSTGRTALVFGGASGINRATSLMLAQDGCTVVVADRDRAGAEETAALVGRHGGLATVVEVDVADHDRVSDCVAGVVAAHGRLDVLVTGAGHLALSPIDELTDGVLDRMLSVHLKGTIHAVQAALPAMRTNGGGRIVCLSSAAAVKGSADHHHYAAAKAGIVGFARSVALQEAASGVTVNAVLPGPIDTAMLRSLSEEHRERLAAAIPVGRLGTAEDVARAVLFFASPDAGFVTGTTLVIAGGAAY